MVLCDVRWSDAKDCSYGDRKNYTDVLGVFMRVETERMYLYPLSDEEMRLVIENTGKDLMVYRFKQPGKRGIMPIDKVLYYNKIDMGIFLFILESCLEHEGYTYNRILYVDTADDSVVQTLIAKYTYASCC